MEGELRLSLLGPPQLSLGGADLNGRLPQKAALLFYYLAFNDHPHDRKLLAGLLWGGKSDVAASRNLRVALAKLRRLLGDYLGIEHTTLAFNHYSDYWLDVEEFENLLELAAKVEGASRRAFLRDAINLWRGDFLQGVVMDGESIQEEWIVPERERLRQLTLNALDQLVEICLEQGDYDAGIQYGQHLLRLESWRESAHRQLMNLYARKGQRSLALKQFDICEDVLAEVFNISPAESTFALYRQIVAMEEGVVTQPLTYPAGAEDATPFLAPQLVPHFVGRYAELAQLGEWLLQPDTRRVYALVGLGGVGKTTLAIELAHRLRGAFPDGVLWMNADKDDPMSVAERWANAYGYDFSRIPDLAERTAVLRDLLDDKRALLVLDDVTNAAKTRPFLPQGNACAILLTTRSAIIAQRLKAQVVDMKVLSPGNGRSLLAGILGEERVAAEEEAVAEICALLEGLPLALSIAGQRLALRSRRQLADYAARLRDETERINLKDQHRAVRASFSLSWEGLDAFHRRLFAQIAVFAGRDFHIEAGAAVAELERYTALERLDELAALSLLREEGVERYRQHPLLADFAQEKLGDDEGPCRSLISYYQTFAADYEEDYARLEPEWENLSAGIAQATRLEAWPAVLALTASLQPAWFRRGRYYEARSAFPDAVAAATALGDQKALARLLYQWGFICWEQNDWDEAQEKLSRSQELFEDQGDLTGVADANFQLAFLAMNKAEVDEAEQYLAVCRQIREKIGDEVGFAEAIRLKAQILYGRGDFKEAKIIFERALQIQDDISDKLGALRTLRLLATTIKQLGYGLALQKKYIQRANILADELQDQVERAILFRQLFEISWREGDLEQAEAYASKSLDLLGKMGDRRNQAMVYYLLSEFYQDQKDFDQALVNGNTSLAICRSNQDRPGIAFSLQRIGNYFACLSQMDKAYPVWEEALGIARQLDHKKLIMELSESLKGCPGSGRT